MVHIIAARHVNVTIIRCVCIASLSLLLFVSHVAAQSSSGMTDPGIASGAPTGSYPLSGFETINLYNGNLNFALPLMNIRGRGGVGHTMLLPIEARWTMTKWEPLPPLGGQTQYFAQQFIGPTFNVLRYGPGFMGRGQVETREGGWGCSIHATTWVKTITRLSFTLPDGTAHQFRDQNSDGAPYHYDNCNWVFPRSRGRVFRSTDGTAMTFVSDNEISDYEGCCPPPFFPPPTDWLSADA